MNWLSNIQVYLDPSLKSFDKDFFLRCEQVLVQSGLAPLEKISELRDGKLPSLLISFNEVIPARLTKKESNILVQYKRPNLDLFASEVTLENCFEVENLGDFNDIWDFIIDLLTVEIKKVELELIDVLGSKTKKLLIKKNVLEFEDVVQESGLETFELSLYQNEPSMIDDINDLVEKELNIKSKVLPISNELILRIDNKNNLVHIPIEYTNNRVLFLEFEGNEKINAKLSIILSTYFKRFSRVRETNLKAQNWNQIINLVEIPIVSLDELGQVLLFNKAFSALSFSVNDCLKLENNQQITIQDQLYRIIFHNSVKENAVIIFFPVGEYLSSSSEVNPSSEELGIISSSLAHELNNPLGGVLAAIDVLKLDDIEPEFAEKLDEMKNGVLRCKKLVETFLGFSRFRPDLYLAKNLKIELCESIQQALDLIRFRLMENNITLQMNFKNQLDYKEVQNPHIVSMIFYLIFGELVTNFSHYNLVKGETSFKIELELVEFSRKFQLVLPKEIDFDDNFLKSKLLSHLLETEKISVLSSDNILEFSFIN